MNDSALLVKSQQEVEMAETQRIERAPKAPLLEKIKEANLSRVFIGLGACVDPDGLASQLAMKRIIEHINPEAQVDCFYRGEWDRSQNRTMREVLNLTPKPYNKFQGDQANQEGKWVTPYTCLIMVDGPASVMPHARDGLKPDFIIDHHEKDGDATAGEDVRLIGSCSAIMWEYVMAVDPELLEGEKGAELATALAIGISTDTVEKTVTKTSQLDWLAESYCGIRRDPEKYNAIKNYPKPSYQKDMETEAWANSIPEGTALASPIGVIPKERKGVVSSIAEEFCGQGPVKTAIALAMIEGDLHFSVRTFNTSMNIDSFIKGTLIGNGKDGFGGGKPGSGAGSIIMPEVFKNLPKQLEQEIFDVLFKAIAHKTFEYTGDGVRIKKEGSGESN